jgi:mono/diheme cytochrome c family protein
MNEGSMPLQGPADLADPARMLAASPALLQGKILRGGMGTGMPSWGPIFTDGQTWDLVSYLYTLQFEYP